MTSVALWGAGIAGSVYGTAARVLGWTIDSIGSRNASRAHTLASDIGARSSFAFESPRDSASDLTIIATPPANHAAAVETVAGSATVVVVAPLTSTQAQADAMISGHPTSQRRLFGWPLVTAPTTQELMRRASSVGIPTNLSMSSSRPLPTWGGYATGDWGGGVTQFGAHDHIALSLLLARFVGLGTPDAVSATMTMTATGVDVDASVAMAFSSGFSATVRAQWNDAEIPRSEIQLAGADGVLRIEASPVPVLEHNGEHVSTPQRPLPDERFRPLHDAGLINLLQTIDAELSSNRPLPHAFTLDFGREVGDIISAAYRSAGLGGEPVPLPFAAQRELSPLELHRVAAER